VAKCQEQFAAQIFSCMQSLEAKAETLSQHNR